MRSQFGRFHMWSSHSKDCCPAFMYVAYWPVADYWYWSKRCYFLVGSDERLD